MKYFDGREVKVGDKVQLWTGCYGIVVCSIDTDEYSTAYPKEVWGYLKSGVLIKADKAELFYHDKAGVLIKTDKAELFHYIEADEDLQLIKRMIKDR